MDTNERRMDTNSSRAVILHKELCYKIQGCVYKVANKYGKGLKEIIYQKALMEQFALEGIKAEEQKRITIYSVDSGKALGTYVPDIIAEDLVVMEIKSTDSVIERNIEQQLSYLKASKYEIGYLVNFSTPKLYMKRFIYTNDRKSFYKKISKNS